MTAPFRKAMRRKHRARVAREAAELRLEYGVRRRGRAVLAAVCAIGLLALSGVAHADPLLLAPDAGQVVLEFPPDGGPALPAPMHRGQVAPSDGVFLDLDRAAVMAAERAELRTENAALKDGLTKADAIPGWVWLVTCAATVGFGAYWAHKH